VSSYSDYSWSDKNDIEAVNTSYYLIGEGALVASAEEGFGVEELRQLITDRLISNRKSL
jgi:hypothetical protein